MKKKQKHSWGLTCILVKAMAVSCIMAQNPIVPHQGLNDPHIHIFNDTAYVYASHDKSADNKKFIMEDWWIWSSPDLVNWTKRSILSPADTYIGAGFSGCWATDVGRKNGKYYWYFSEKNQQTGVVVGESPVGPWKDPLGKPLLTEDLTPTDEYDMTIYEEAGEHYIIFGVWDYYIAKLNEDMISLAEAPQKITIEHPRGPYNPDGKNLDKPTDDKPFLHKYRDQYYLSWGCFYAMSDSLYGPYEYKGTVIHEDSFAEGYASPTWPNGFLQGRHGSFFQWHDQWYYAYCDISQTGNRYFRDTFISYVHYKKNGEMAFIRVDGVGVGRYDVTAGKIEAEDFFKVNQMEKVELSNGQFGLQNTGFESWAYYPNVEGLSREKSIQLALNLDEPASFILEVRQNSPSGKSLGVLRVNRTDAGQQVATLPLSVTEERENLVILLKGAKPRSVILDSISLTDE